MNGILVVVNGQYTWLSENVYWCKKSYKLHIWIVFIYKTETWHRLLLAPDLFTLFQGSMGVYPLLLLLHVAFVAFSTAQTLPDPSGKASLWHTKALVNVFALPPLEKTN